MPIRTAVAEDFGAVRELLAATNLPHDDLTPAHLVHFLVEAADGALVGVVGLELRGTVALLRSLAVAPAGRKTGLGGKLEEAAEEHARRQGIEALYLLTTTAAPFFERRGYRRTTRADLPEAIPQTEEATRLCPVEAICMMKRLIVSATT